jgi:hypothetical protein
VKKLILALLIAALPGSSQAVDIPGMGLNHPGLDDFSFGQNGPGRVVSVKGQKDPKYANTTSHVRGFLKAGVPESPAKLYATFPTSYGNTGTGSPPTLTNTLIPTHAAGIAGHITNTSSGGIGPMLQAIIYEPDQVKRKGSGRDGAKSRLQIKQKSHVAFRFGRFRGTFEIPMVSGGITAEKCKAQVDIKRDPNKSPPGRSKFKVKCSGSDPEVMRIKARLLEIFKKNRSGFDLDGTSTFF